MEFLDLAPLSRASGEIRLPGSKSISNRSLLLAALAEGTTRVSDLLDAEDVQMMRGALEALGVPLQTGTDGALTVTGTGGRFPQSSADLFLGNAGTAVRPLTAALAVLGGDYVIRGVPRMHERPIGDLVDGLQSLGAAVSYLEKPGYPPLRIGQGEIRGNEVAVRGDVSSQFLSALLMALPLTGRAFTVRVIGELISRPYVEITLNLMRRFGIAVEAQGSDRFHLPGGQRYRSPGALQVEGDASSASYFLAAGAVAGGPVRVIGAGRDSIQGDVKFADALAAMGAEIKWGGDWIEASLPAGGRLQGLTLDCNHIPDAAMTLAIVALFAEGTTTLTNIGSWRVKETDRIAAMATELRKVGATVEEAADWIRVTPPARLIPNAEIGTYDDHRMAMCFSLVALGGVPIRILDPGCVRKTFPTYFTEFGAIARP